jgi:hypothetical protein
VLTVIVVALLFSEPTMATADAEIEGHSCNISARMHSCIIGCRAWRGIAPVVVSVSFRHIHK